MERLLPVGGALSICACRLLRHGGVHQLAHGGRHGNVRLRLLSRRHDGSERHVSITTAVPSVSSRPSARLGARGHLERAGGGDLGSHSFDEAAATRNDNVYEAPNDQANYRAARLEQKVAQVSIAMWDKKLTQFESTGRGNEERT
jgi:hypothetical protein